MREARAKEEKVSRIECSLLKKEEELKAWEEAVQVTLLTQRSCPCLAPPTSCCSRRLLHVLSRPLVASGCQCRDTPIPGRLQRRESDARRVQSDAAEASSRLAKANAEASETERRLAELKAEESSLR